ncbi:MAG: peptide chain release factor 2 [candidate division Zixibacteria bacterium]|nr:peptide chain release factor 2 [candidate division Zixibacteria bacterium]MBU1470789.1 peptide chain release factor 2 [candidate division Zixibacteria bacterium]MBU2625312.1 peptide chain release factor 2 [candidate division Zixibacteria bacterium]
MSTIFRNTGRNSNRFGVIFDLEQRESKIAKLEKQSTDESFWNDSSNAQSVLKQLKLEKNILEEIDGLDRELQDMEVLMELVEEEDSAEAQQEFDAAAEKFAKRLDAFEFKTYLSDPDDPSSALLTIHPGAGGTESMDWASMILRMYMRWAEQNGFETDTIDFQAGDEAGVKSATIEIKGDYAYGYLKGESGVHRLVRISPFDANKRRHTSFCSVFVLPEVEGDINIEIKSDDLRIDTYRASGAGGQHVNKVSSAVRITHEPTGIVVQCQSERSQLKNRESAMKVLKARLYQLEKEKEEAKKQKLEATKKKIEWGSQIRSYVFHPYNMIKDHRTDYETSNVTAVMDGNLSEFINSYLMFSK